MSTPHDLLPDPSAPLPEGEEKTAAVRAMFDVIAPRYDLVNRIMTFRMDVGWRRRTVGALGVAPGSVVVDLACGTGDLARELAGRGLTPVGVDLSFGMLAAAPEPFPRVQADGSALPFADASVGGATCGFAMRNFTDLGATFDELSRIIADNGRIALLEVAEPPNPLIRLGHSVWFNHVVPVVGGLLSERAAYAYLPRSVAYLPPAQELTGMLASSGFGHIRHTMLSGGIAQLFTATRSPR